MDHKENARRSIVYTPDKNLITSSYFSSSHEINRPNKFEFLDSEFEFIRIANKVFEISARR